MTLAQPSDEESARRRAMRICAGAEASELEAIASKLAGDETAADLRPSEKGLVMVRGRVGGEGPAFNLGEATVVRAAIRLADGTIGFAYHLGRDGRKARNAAVLDALWQRQATRPAVDAALAEVASRLNGEARRQAEHTAATRVNFFTMTRGED